MKVNPHNILIEATKKLNSINTNSDWNNELLSKSPPVLWFGNSKSNKKKILTIGANPSRWEFLDKSLMKDCSKPLIKSCYEHNYLLNKRFYHLPVKLTYNAIINNVDIRNEIISSFDNYFDLNPYSWFGKNKDSSYNAEGLLRRMKASYFNINSKYRACHIDFFPFATISDYHKIKGITERDILSNNWSEKILYKLIDYFNPETILIFGKTNFNLFCKYFEANKKNSIKWKSKIGSSKCDYWITTYQNIKVIGLSVNLGNPRGFSAETLRELGSYLNEK